MNLDYLLLMKEISKNRMLRLTFQSCPSLIFSEYDFDLVLLDLSFEGSSECLRADLFIC